jgi:hypothetical protein
LRERLDDVAAVRVGQRVEDAPGWIVGHTRASA